MMAENYDVSRQKVDAFKEQIRHAQECIKRIQDTECKHAGLTGKYRANTGNYCPEDDSYWVEFSCPTCDKHWTEEQSECRFGKSKDGHSFARI